MAKLNHASFADRFSAEIAETPSGPLFTLDRKNIRAFCEAARLEGCELSNITAADRKDHIEVVVHLLETPSSQIGIKADVPMDDLTIDSLVPVWPGADWQEREVYDCYGVEFNDHPNMARILIDDNFEGFPLRKSYKLEEVEW